MALVDVTAKRAEPELAGSQAGLPAAPHLDEGGAIFGLELVCVAQLLVELTGQQLSAL